jgi:hypothetical protein
MIPKSGHRFSEKIMLKKAKAERQFTAWHDLNIRPAWRRS